MLASLSKRELLAMCEMMAKDVPAERLQNMLQMVKTSSSPPPAAPAMEEKKAKRARAEMDFSKYPFQQMAFWVAYFGHEYQGLQSANPCGLQDDKTIEWQLFQAFRKVKLIPEDESGLEMFSRCGRTDRGVSALGQVLSLNVRTNLPGKPEIDYADMLNKSLPENIFVLASAKVDPTKFNARFSCTSRTYRYFIRPSQALDLQKMSVACKYLEGTHDFRNFCKIDLSNARVFVRRIDSCSIAANGQYVEIRGSGFLWHQIRILMAVLFHVAAGLEEPEIVKELLDVKRYPARPSFNMAEDLPLVLFASEYDPELEWKFGEKSTLRIVNTMEQKLGREEIQCEMTRLFLHTVKQESNIKLQNTAVVDLDYEDISTAAKREKHIKFAKRKMCKSVDERLAEEQQMQRVSEEGDE